jgi:hypothetical protein
MKRNDPMGFAENHTEEKNSEKLGRRFVSKLLQEVIINSIQYNKSHLLNKNAKWNTTQKMPMSTCLSNQVKIQINYPQTFCYNHYSGDRHEMCNKNSTRFT